MPRSASTAPAIRCTNAATGRSRREPINEALAAALILHTGWRGTTPLTDPMCGGGTLAIEAAWLALGRPPGLTRKRFGFQGWMDFKIDEWTTLRDQARAGIAKALPAPVTGSDERGDAVSFAIDNAKAAGVGHLVRFAKRHLRDFTPPGNAPGTLICNPPYGERLGEEKDLRSVYQLLGKVLQERCQGWTAFVFTGNPRLASEIGLRPDERWPLFNGKIPCHLLKYQL